MNQPLLFKLVEATIADRNKWSSWYSETEINRGRTELRTVTVSNDLEGINKEWIGIKQLISMERIEDRQGKKTKEMAYFISSKNSNTFKYKEGIRLHWEIENTLHCVKDVTLKEDASKIVTGNAPQNISTIKNISMNIIIRNNHYKSMAQAMRLVSNNIPLLKSMIF